MDVVSIDVDLSSCCLDKLNKPYFQYLHQSEDNYSFDTIQQITTNMTENGWGILVVCLNEWFEIDSYPQPLYAYMLESNRTWYKGYGKLTTEGVYKDINWDRVVVVYGEGWDKESFITYFDSLSLQKYSGGISEQCTLHFICI